MFKEWIDDNATSAGLGLCGQNSLNQKNEQHDLALNAEYCYQTLILGLQHRYNPVLCYADGQTR